jgi:alginate O-acetyltransferase complex protein AlgI
VVFTSAAFVIFFIVFFFLYWFVFFKSKQIQNSFILISSYFFYVWWDWRFLFLLIFISLSTFYIGKKIQETSNEKNKKIYLISGILQSILVLLYFKYTNFFFESFVNLFSIFNSEIEFHSLKIILPLGVSFYTFKVVSYIIDVYNEKISASENIVTYLTYVSFFTTIVSGPIDRAKLFIPQLEKSRQFNSILFTDGLRQILWGFFKKIVIADSCATFTNQIFDNYSVMSGVMLLFGAFLYTIQLYSDFSGYSDMAIGFGRLLGFNSMKNFDFPYFSMNIADYWRKWHISLTSWFTEYLFTPMTIKFRDWGKKSLVLSIIVTFLVSGLWHGANWTFVFWGLLHGLYFVPMIIKGSFFKIKKINPNSIFPSFFEFYKMLILFILITFTNIFFRAENLTRAFEIISKIFSESLFEIPVFNEKKRALMIILLIAIFMIIEWIGRNGKFALENIGLNWRKPVRWIFYFVLAYTILLFSGNNQQFIYFQF